MDGGRKTKSVAYPVTHENLFFPRAAKPKKKPGKWRGGFRWRSRRQWWEKRWKNVGGGRLDLNFDYSNSLTDTKKTTKLDQFKVCGADLE